MRSNILIILLVLIIAAAFYFLGKRNGAGQTRTDIVENVTLVKEGTAYFPDAKTERGQKHLRSLINLVQQGVRAVCFFLVQRGDVCSFAPAEFIDPKYAELFWQALEAGVEVYPYKAIVSPEGIGLGEILPVNKS